MEEIIRRYMASVGLLVEEALDRTMTCGRDY